MAPGREKSLGWWGRGALAPSAQLAVAFVTLSKATPFSLTPHWNICRVRLYSTLWLWPQLLDQITASFLHLKKQHAYLFILHARVQRGGRGGALCVHATVSIGRSENN